MSVGREIHIVFVDLRKGFDFVSLAKLWDTMVDEKINTVYINATKSICEVSKLRKSWCK